MAAIQPVFIRYYWFFALLLAFGIGTTAVVFEFFPEAGSYLAIRPAEPVDGDLVVILGGGWSERIQKGEVLLKKGYARRVLLTGVSPERDARKGPLDTRYSELLAAGIAPDNIYLDNSAKNTWQEAHVIRDLLQVMRWHTVLIVSDPPHLRRLAWVCNRVLRKANIDYTLVPTRPLWWDEEHWWRNAKSRWFVALEYLKLLGYFLLYH